MLFNNQRLSKRGWGCCVFFALRQRRIEHGIRLAYEEEDQPFTQLSHSKLTDLASVICLRRADD